MNKLEKYMRNDMIAAFISFLIGGSVLLTNLYNVPFWGDALGNIYSVLQTLSTLLYIIIFLAAFAVYKDKKFLASKENNYIEVMASLKNIHDLYKNRSKTIKIFFYIYNVCAILSLTMAGWFFTLAMFISSVVLHWLFMDTINKEIGSKQ